MQIKLRCLHLSQAYSSLYLIAELIFTLFYLGGSTSFISSLLSTTLLPANFELLAFFFSAASCFIFLIFFFCFSFSALLHLAALFCSSLFLFFSSTCFCTSTNAHAASSSFSFMLEAVREEDHISQVIFSTGKWEKILKNSWWRHLRLSSLSSESTGKLENFYASFGGPYMLFCSSTIISCQAFLGLKA